MAEIQAYSIPGIVNSLHDKGFINIILNKIFLALKSL